MLKAKLTRHDNAPTYKRLIGFCVLSLSIHVALLSIPYITQDTRDSASTGSREVSVVMVDVRAVLPEATPALTRKDNDTLPGRGTSVDNKHRSIEADASATLEAVAAKDMSLEEPSQTPTADITNHTTVAVMEREGTAGSDSYIARVAKLIGAQVYYPRLARKSGTEGQVTVLLLVATDGSLEDVFVATSSGSSLLDRAGVRIVKKAAPFPPPPSGTITIEAPIVFSLSKST